MLTTSLSNSWTAIIRDEENEKFDLLRMEFEEKPISASGQNYIALLQRLFKDIHSKEAVLQCGEP